MKRIMDYMYPSVIECMSNICEAWGSSPAPHKREEREREKKKQLSFIPFVSLPRSFRVLGKCSNPKPHTRSVTVCCKMASGKDVKCHQHKHKEMSRKVDRPVTSVCPHCPLYTWTKTSHRALSLCTVSVCQYLWGPRRGCPHLEPQDLSSCGRRMVTLRIGGTFI